jgi:integrase/recombinase XerD
VDFADRIKTPKSPKHRKIIIKRGDIVDILNQTEKLSEMQRLRLKAGILLSATSGLRAFELYSLTPDAIDVENRTIYLNANQTKDLEERVVFFNVEAMKALTEYIEKLNEEHDRLFALSTVEKNFRKLNTHLRMRHMRKFFSQQSDRLGMPTAIKKILMGHVISDDEYVFFTKSKDVDLGHYDFQDDEDLKKIYDRYWKDFRILG